MVGETEVLGEMKEGPRERYKIETHIWLSQQRGDGGHASDKVGKGGERLDTEGGPTLASKRRRGCSSHANPSGPHGPRAPDDACWH